MKENNILSVWAKIKEQYVYMLKISEQQLALLKNQSGDNDITVELLELIDKRGKIIKIIDELQVNISNYDEQAGSPAIIEKKEDIREIILAIRQNDAESQALLKTEMNNIGTRITNVKQNKKAHKAYTGESEYADAWFFDRLK